MRRTSVRWWAIFGVFFGLFVQAGRVQAQTIYFGGEAKDTVYGKSACDSNKVIKFDWGLSPSSTTLPTSITLDIYLGNSTSGIRLYSGAVNMTQVKQGTVTDPNDAKYLGLFQVTFDGTLNQSKKTQEGMYTDEDKSQILTIRDMIGHLRYTDNQAITPYEQICDPKPAALGGDESMDIFLKATYNVVIGTGTSKEEPSNTLNVRFDLTPPPAPDMPQIVAGDSKLDIKFDKTDEENYYQFDVYFSEKPFSAISDSGVFKHNSSPITASTYSLTSLSNSKTYYIASVAYDKAGNASDISPVASAQPTPLTDFFEAYKQAGGKDTGFSGGGYCFIATAAYGSYDAHEVQRLRTFRDRYLQPYAWGRAFVAWYYEHSPRLAAWIAKHPTARRATQVALWPVVQWTALWLWSPFLGGLVLLAALVLLFFVTRKMFSLMGSAARTLGKRFGYALGIAFLVSSLWLGLAATAHAEASPRNFGLELRGGPYFTQIDQETGLSGKPFSSLFGTTTLPYLEVGFEWLFLKKYGSLGLGATAGISWMQGKALKQDGTADENNTMAFWMIPLRLELIYRMDYFVHSHKFPLVPYVRGGLDYNFWFVTDSNGSLASYQDSAGKDLSAFGGRFGFHFGAGLQFLLDVLDPTTARTFDMEVGVNHTYLFVEWNISWVGVLTPGINLSDNSIRAGLMFQF
ncbi:MAG: hypothetical protein H6727_05960 [Myxococcales bacterium]|nr:hypothetical protein [Myxococcales bacterium]